jgi:ABC-2 type transport system ATP-binding protein
MGTAIETEGLTRRFGDLVAVDELTLEVAEGEVFGFLGPNGAGKTTTVAMLTTLLDPSSGSARVAGHDVQAEPRRVREAVGYLPERMPLWERMTARETLRTVGRLHGLDGEAREDRIEDLLETVGLPDVVSQTTGTFSKGMRQRLGLAAALLPEPEVLFLDEPASGLDPTGQREIRTLLRDVADLGATVFLCTHHLAQAEAICDRVGVIRGGELQVVRRLEALQEADEDLEELYRTYAEGEVPEEPPEPAPADDEPAEAEGASTTFQLVDDGGED